MTSIKHPENIAPFLPYLVQRMELRKYGAEDRKGVDRYFSMDYMGSSEFEWGALPNTLKVLRAMTLPPPVKLTVMRDGVAVTGWYVGPESHLEAAKYWFQHCASTRDGQYGFDMKEMPRIYDAYQPVNVVPPRGSKSAKRRAVAASAPFGTEIVGWWCVDAGESISREGCWAIFREQGQANNWLQGLKG
jgi:hypothetical protein